VAWLAGTDEERLADFNAALRDPSVRALFTAVGGKGSCRIADRLDFVAARSDPKFLVGISDITALQLSLWKHCRLVGVHGSFVPDGQDSETLRKALMTSEGICLRSRADEPTFALTTRGTATGRLIGGSLLPMSAVAGWALPSLKGAILLLEAVNMGPGVMDSQLTMLRKAGHLTGLAGIAVGQFTDCFHPVNGFTVVDLLRGHLQHVRIPILGGVPVGHGYQPQSTRVGTMAVLDAGAGTLTVG
jgi:muramoyltetrapeptide carboxypeptidase